MGNNEPNQTSKGILGPGMDSPRHVPPDNVVVMMPLGGQDPTKKRECILEFMRIKYIVENQVKVPSRHGETKKAYEVRAFNLEVGNIPRDILKEIAEADLMIGMVTEVNVNVIYELAVRNLLKDETLLVVKGNREKVLPVYMQPLAGIDYDAVDQRVTDRIRTIAEDNLPELDLDSEIPRTLKQEIDKHDGSLKHSLEVALWTIEHKRPKRPDYLVKLADYLDPGLFLQPWKSYYPYSMLRIKWKGKSERLCYLPEDMDGEPVVYEANNAFYDLFNYQPTRSFDSEFSQRLTQEDMIQLLNVHNLVEKEDLEEFLEDQRSLTENIILKGGLGKKARVPLVFNSHHPKFPNQAFLPCLFGQRKVGYKKRPHTTYLIVIYVEVERRGRRKSHTLSEEVDNG